MQLRELREYCSRRGWTFAREYVDTDWGNGRPELDRLMKDATVHRFDLVLVWRLDRFGRSVRHSIQKLRALSSWGIPFVVTNQGFDTRQELPTRLLLIPLMTAVADFEREMMSERVKAGLDTARGNGVKLGRPKVAFDRRKATAMRRRGVSLRAIAAEVGVSKGTVERLVHVETGHPRR
jgi:DNA invertase Pin-like site-specific DNA recombinase